MWKVVQKPRLLAYNARMPDESAQPLVLMVEDDQLLSSLLAHKLTAETLRVIHVPTGEEALQVLQRDEKPNLMLLDIRLPGIDGFTVLEKMRADPTTTAIPVIVLSNFGEKSDLERSRKLGVLQHIVKISLTLDEVATVVRNALGGQRMAAAAV